MKVNMNCFTVDEIISHLEIYGDDNEGNILKVIKSLKEDKDYAIDELVEWQQGDITEDLQYEIEELKDEIAELEDQIKELKEGK